ncbi:MULTISPECIES: TerC family protein [unclassified Polynucleobacter]|jgi:YjbE family integral membrane protein|uniref:TerC family protein n=1 Tax=unclassified Polynucleobacter TaxID=2640945 RepID=UPI0025736774|nr:MULTISPECIES: TerC family protein [unclassified Polynucleobacter]BEI43360.1 TerC family protein [Polynucleobacter sp. HIN10]BEI45136.1 TerC family protein [Polynucleobacter sp. HIN11]
MELLAMIDWSVVIQIIIIDLLLGGDNAVVIALACRNLHPNQRKKGIIYGTAGAIILRVILVAFAVTLLQIPFLKLVGGALLLWIGYKLMVQHDEEEHNLDAPDKLFAAIKTIIVADIVMSLDNVLAIAGAAGQVDDAAHQVGYVVFGLIVSVPIIIAGSKVVLFLIDRFPLIVTAGAGLLGWIAGGMMVTDPAIVKQFGEGMAGYSTIAGITGAVAVMAFGELMKRRAKSNSKAA